MESLISASYLYLLPDYIFKRNQEKLTVRLASTYPTLIGGFVTLCFFTFVLSVNKTYSLARFSLSSGIEP